MDLGLAGKTAIVTGASGGIGGAIARDFAREGVKLTLCYKSHDCGGLLSEVQEFGSEAMAIQADVSVSEEARKVVGSAYEKFGRIDILVNCAGVSLTGSVEETKESDWDRIMGINLKSIFLLSQAVIPYMKKQKWGRIINVGSVVAKTSTNARPWLDPDSSSKVVGAAYAASKAGVHAITRTLAKELAAFGVTVNCVAPGPVKTAMVPVLHGPMVGQVPVGRIGQPEEISAFVALVASDRGGFMTGEIIDINGGLWMD